jgi:hypothetical protein
MDAGLWHANGWPHLGLWSPELGRVDRRRTSGSIRAALERIERAAGLPEFCAHGLERFGVAAAGEVAHTYLGLRRRFPGVHVDFVDMAPTQGEVLGFAELYPAQLPQLHRTALEVWSSDGVVVEPSELVGRADPAWREWVRVECGWLPRRGARRPRDLSCAGALHLSVCLGHASCYRAKIDLFERRRATALRRGTTTWLPPVATSIASATVAHEFGHLLEAAMWSFDEALAVDVYGVLSAELFGGGAGADVSQWRRHLVNYPAVLLPAGPATGGGRRRVALRRCARRDIGWRLGRYALVSREELFAEAFALAVTGSDPALRSVFARRLRPLLADAGIARR